MSVGALTPGLATYLTSRSRFADVREGAIRPAEDLYGEGTGPGGGPR
jgi:Zn-dependent metalloprotease